MGLPRDISGSPKEFQADDFGRQENFSASLTTAVKCREIEDFSAEDLLRLSAVENRLDKTDISDDVSEIPPSTEDDHLKKRDASDKGVISDISVEKTLPVSKVCQPLSMMNVKEKTKPKAKSQQKNVFDLLSSTSGDLFEKKDCSNISPSTPGDLFEKKDCSNISPSTPGDLFEKKDCSNISPSTPGDLFEKKDCSNISPSTPGDLFEKKDCSNISPSTPGDLFEKKDCSNISPSTPGDLLEKKDCSNIPPSTLGDLLEKKDCSNISPSTPGDLFEKKDCSNIPPSTPVDLLEKKDCSNISLSTPGDLLEKKDCSDIPPSTPGDLLEKKDCSDIPPSTLGDLLEKEDVSDKNLISDVRLKKTSVIPKALQGSSIKNTNHKYGSENEKTSATSKRQCKSVIPDTRPSTTGDHVTSDLPPFTAGNDFEKDDLSDKDDVSRFPLKSLRIPKVARRLSVKNAKRKYDSKKEKTNLKAKRQRKQLLKDLPFDTDFLSRECLRPSTGKQESNEAKCDSDSDSDSDSSPPPSPPPTGPHECKICQRSYVHEKSLKRHMKTHSESEELFQCQKCDAAFRQSCDLKKHERMHDGIRPYSCDKCAASFTQLSALNRHAKIHTDEKDFSCAECGKRFIQSSSLKRHEKGHKQTKTFTCEFCQTMFSEKHHLESHVNSVHRDEVNQEQEEFACEICSKVFFRFSNYWTHKRGHDKNTRNAYKCEQCNRTFSTKSNLNRHCNFQHEKVPYSDTEKPYPCTVCGERFSRNVSLKLHMRFHDTPGVHRCNVCPKTFTIKTWLRKHMALHASNGFQCEQCLSIFRSHFRLCLHRRQMGGKCTHSVAMFSKQAIIERRKYACKYCDAKLSLRTRLAKHVRKAHPEVQAFTCDVCEKGFCYYLDFLSHRKIHRYIPYQCKTCRLAFPRYRELLAHFQEQTHISKALSRSQPAEDPTSIAKLSTEANSVANSSQTIIGKTDVVACSENKQDSSTRTDTATSKDTSVISQPVDLSAGAKIVATISTEANSVDNSSETIIRKTDTAGAKIVANIPQKVIANKLSEQTDVTACSENQQESSTRTKDTFVTSQPAEDQRSISDLSTGINIVDNSTQKVIENKRAEEPDMAAASSEKQQENSTRTDTAAAENTSSSANLYCQICSLVFLAAVHYRAHCRLTHGEKKYPCQKCSSGFDFLTKFRVHMRTVHPIPKKSPKKKKSDKLIKPKVAPRLDPVKLDKLLKARVKEAMKKSKFRISEAKKKSRDRNRPKSFVID